MFFLTFIFLQVSTYEPIDPASFSEPSQIFDAIKTLGNDNVNEEELVLKLKRLENIHGLINGMKTLLIARVESEAMDASRARVSNLSLFGTQNFKHLLLQRNHV